MATNEQVFLLLEADREIAKENLRHEARIAELEEYRKGLYAEAGVEADGTEGITVEVKGTPKNPMPAPIDELASAEVRP